MSEISAFTASLGHNGRIDVFAIGAPGNDGNGTAVYLTRTAPGQPGSPWTSLGKPGVGAIGVQSITGPDGYGHLLARSGRLRHHRRGRLCRQQPAWDGHVHPVTPQRRGPLW